MKSREHCSYPGTRAPLWSKRKAAVALMSPFWMQEPMGKAADPLAVKQMCRHSHAVPAESEADLDSKGRSKGTLGSDHSLVPTGIQGLPRLQEQDRGSRELQHLPGSSQRRVSDTAIPPRARGTLEIRSTCWQELALAPLPRADRTRGAQAVTASGTP